MPSSVTATALQTEKDRLTNATAHFVNSFQSPQDILNLQNVLKEAYPLRESDDASFSQFEVMQIENVNKQVNKFSLCNFMLYIFI